MISELLWRINFVISFSSYGHDYRETCKKEVGNVISETFQ